MRNPFRRDAKPDPELARLAASTAVNDFQTSEAALKAMSLETGIDVDDLRIMLSQEIKLYIPNDEDTR